jgi:regulator of sigma D
MNIIEQQELELFNPFDFIAFQELPIPEEQVTFIHDLIDYFEGKYPNLIERINPLLESHGGMTFHKMVRISHSILIDLFVYLTFYDISVYIYEKDPAAITAKQIIKFILDERWVLLDSLLSVGNHESLHQIIIAQDEYGFTPIEYLINIIAREPVQQRPNQDNLNNVIDKMTEIHFLDVDISEVTFRSMEIYELYAPWGYSSLE